MNYYFEFGDNVVGRPYQAMGWKKVPAKYCVRYGTPGLKPLVPAKLSYLAKRIWAEDEDGRVSFVKNRLEPYPAVDSKEFMWVKLSSVKV